MYLPPLIYYYRTWKHKDLPLENYIVLERDWLARQRGFGRIQQHIEQERKHDDEIRRRVRTLTQLSNEMEKN